VLVTGKATLDPASGNLISRAPIIAHVKHDQYGVPKFVHPADVNSDGVVDALDTQHWLNAWREYRTHNTTSNPPSEIWKGTVDSNESGVVDESTDGADPTQPSATNTDWVAFQAQYAAATVGNPPTLAEQLGNLPLYAGYWWDDAIGLYHVRHRVYRPEWGRWLQRDPLGYAPGWNLYQYVNGMPRNAVDPMGLDGHSLGDALRRLGLDGLGDVVDDALDGVEVVIDRVIGDPYAEHSADMMKAANQASRMSNMADRLGNPKRAQSIRMSMSLDMHNSDVMDEFMTDGSFAEVGMITTVIPTGWAGGRLAGWLGNTARGKAINLFGEKMFRIAGYVTDPIKGTVIRIGKYMTDAVKAAAVRIGKVFRPADTTRVYRAVSEAEYQQILRTGTFEHGGMGAMEGKWFTETVESARKHGDFWYTRQGKTYRIVEADLPNGAKQHLDPNIDRYGPGRYVEIEDLRGVGARPAKGCN
jgi:RHS repeat-associated protein